MNIVEQLHQLWPVMCGSQGFIAAFLAWRGAVEMVVPFINGKAQSWFTELLVASPRVANDIVQNKKYQAVALTLRITIGILLPTEASVLVHQVKEEAKSGNTDIFTQAEIKPQTPPP